MGCLNAANYLVTNVNVGPGDTLYADDGNTLLSVGSIVTMGYFPASFDVAGNVANIAALIANYTIVASGAPGTASATLSGSFDGYVERPEVDGAALLGADPLIGRSLYSFIGEAATLAASTKYALVQVGTLAEDAPNEFTYVANPSGQPILIGTTGVFAGNAGAGPGPYITLKLAAVPEPSVFILSAFGVLGLLRRRR